MQQKLASALCLVLASGCSLITDSFVTNEFSGDEFPIEVDTTSGAIVVGLREAGVADRTAVLDLIAPFTLADEGVGAAQEIRTTTLEILGEDGPGGPLARPRARLEDAQLVSLHPCAEATCVVGTPASPAPYNAIIGADVLAGDAVRLRLGADQIFVLADIGGDEESRTKACDGVFPSPYRGGGTAVIAGTEVAFGGRRIALGTCLGADPSPTKSQAFRGTDALFVVSTSIGISLLSEATYRRYIAGHPCDPALPPDDPRCPVALDALPEGAVNLPSGTVTGRRATLPDLAFAASSSADQRAPCRQVYASHFMLQRDCSAGDADCPCNNDADDPLFCTTPAILSLAPPAGIEVLVVSDSNETLQSLRTELRPNQPEVDGILGTQALRAAEIDIDYPHNRLLTRCTGDGCVTRPQLAERSGRRQMAGCLADAPPGPAFPVP